MKPNMYSPAEQIVNIMDRIYKLDLTTASGGNLSILDDKGDIWITPSGIDKGSLTTDDIVLVKANGTVHGKHKPSLELPFHRAIYEKRPDVHAVLHAHSPSITAFSITGRMPDVSLVLDSYAAGISQGLVEYVLPGSDELAHKLAAAFEKGPNAVMLENHGIVVAHNDLFSAYKVYEILDYCAGLELKVLRFGKKKVPDVSAYDALMTRSSLIYNREKIVDEEQNVIKEICHLAQRAYAKKLLCCGFGAVSRRITAGEFIITPEDCDFLELDIKELITIKAEDDVEFFTHNIKIHKKIYDANPCINAVITAAPPNIMAFGASEHKFDSRIIPESYLMLRDVERFSLDKVVNNPEDITKNFSDINPIAIIENYGAIVTGETLFKAYDRLEVLDYSAKAILDSTGIGDIKTINDEGIRDIEIAFKLPQKNNKI